MVFPSSGKMHRLGKFMACSFARSAERLQKNIDHKQVTICNYNYNFISSLYLNLAMRMSPVRFFPIPTGLSIIQRGFAHAARASEN